jgi:hypothetical protein
MKKLTGLNTGLLLVGLLVVALAACSTSTPEVPATVDVPVVVEDITIVDEDNNTYVDSDALDHAFSGIATTDLSEAEAEGLSFMREEEKLARDVYLMLYEQWGIRIFQNIAKGCVYQP